MTPEARMQSLLHVRDIAEQTIHEVRNKLLLPSIVLEKGAARNEYVGDDFVTLQLADVVRARACISTIYAQMTLLADAVRADQTAVFVDSVLKAPEEVTP